MEFFDTHTHLQDKAFNQDRDRVIKRAADAGVKYLINVGDSLASSARAVVLAKTNKNLYASVGIHPHNAKYLHKETSESLQSLAKNKEVVAIGEIGLDFYRNFSPQEKQRKAFEKQLIIARELGLPVIIHTREAYSETFKILRKYQIKGVFHAFSSEKEDAKQALDMGFYIGIGGILTFKNSSLKDVVRFIPIEKIILETDAPYLAPSPMRGKRNEPAFLIYTAKFLSEIKNCSLEEVASITTRNARTLFLPKKCD